MSVHNGAVAYEIEPEPSEAERAALLAALAEEEQEPRPGGSAWWRAGLPEEPAPYATAPLRSSRGAARA